MEIYICQTCGHILHSQMALCDSCSTPCDGNVVAVDAQIVQQTVRAFSGDPKRAAETLRRVFDQEHKNANSVTYSASPAVFKFNTRIWGGAKSGESGPTDSNSSIGQYSSSGRYNDQGFGAEGIDATARSEFEDPSPNYSLEESENADPVSAVVDYVTKYLSNDADAGLDAAPAHDEGISPSYADGMSPADYLSDLHDNDDLNETRDENPEQESLSGSSNDSPPDLQESSDFFSADAMRWALQQGGNELSASPPELSESSHEFDSQAETWQPADEDASEQEPGSSENLSEYVDNKDLSLQDNFDPGIRWERQAAEEASLVSEIVENFAPTQDNQEELLQDKETDESSDPGCSATGDPIMASDLQAAVAAEVLESSQAQAANVDALGNSETAAQAPEQLPSSQSELDLPPLSPKENSEESALKPAEEQKSSQTAQVPKEVKSGKTGVSARFLMIAAALVVIIFIPAGLILIGMKDYSSADRNSSSQLSPQQPPVRQSLLTEPTQPVPALPSLEKAGNSISGHAAEPITLNAGTVQISPAVESTPLPPLEQKKAPPNVSPGGMLEPAATPEIKQAAQAVGQTAEVPLNPPLSVRTPVQNVMSPPSQEQKSSAQSSVKQATQPQSAAAGNSVLAPTGKKVLSAAEQSLAGKWDYIYENSTGGTGYGVININPAGSKFRGHGQDTHGSFQIRGFRQKDVISFDKLYVRNGKAISKMIVYSGKLSILNDKGSDFFVMTGIWRYTGPDKNGNVSTISGPFEARLPLH